MGARTHKLPDGVETTHPGHNEVDKGDVRLELLGELDGCLTVGGLPDDLDPRRLEPAAQSMAH
jgi:hypothetical protein